jgi:cephalosporin hydroxylase
MSKVRTIVSLVLLPVLTVAAIYLVFRMGYLDGLVRDRVMRLSEEGQIGYLDDVVRDRARRLSEEAVLPGPNCSWYGVPIWQFPEDLMIYQEIIMETKPDVIIETGTFFGGLTLYLSTVLDVVNPEGKVLTVDVKTEGTKERFAKLPLPTKDRLTERIVVFTGSSTAPEIVQDMIKHIKPGAKVLVILDSAHDKAHVAKELEMYAPLVTPGSYLIVNDTYLESFAPTWEQAGAAAAMRDFLATNKNFEVDKSRDKFIISTAPGGFLKRIN